MAIRSQAAAGILTGLLERALVFLLLLFLIALLPRLLPGDPLSILLDGDTAGAISSAEKASLRRQLGLDAGLWEQFAQSLRRLAHGDLGYSAQHSAPVGSLLLRALPWTCLLVCGATPLFVLTGVFCAIEAGRLPGSPVDRFLTGAMTMLAATPPFAAAMILIMIFAAKLRIFPLAGAEPIIPSADRLWRVIDIAWHAALPITALALHELARYFFVLRGEASALLKRPFVIGARARGIGAWRERRDYFGRNLVAAILARLGHSLSTLFGAVLFVEVVFSYPGIGLMTYNAVLERDYALLQGSVTVISGAVLILNWALDSAATLIARRG